MRTRDIKRVRMNVGKFLHTYYTKFGEEKYDQFIEKLGPVLEKDYGEPFSQDNLRIMEVEYVELGKKMRKKRNTKDT